MSGGRGLRTGAGGIVVAAACVVMLLTGLVASARSPARHTSQEDPNDTNGALDVRLVQLLHANPAVPAWSIVTFNAWTTQRMWDKGYLLVYLDTFWGESPDYYALIRSDGTRIHGELFRDRADGSDIFLRTLTAWRADDHSVAVKVPLSALRIGPSRSVYRWHVVTVITSAICPMVCIDRVPDAGVVEQLLPGATTPPPTTTTPPPTTTAEPPTAPEGPATEPTASPEPTTAEPTTDEPTTPEPTTAEPTTDEPTGSSEPTSG